MVAGSKDLPLKSERVSDQFFGKHASDSGKKDAKCIISVSHDKIITEQTMKPSR
jgi:hypothetical protein